MRNHKGMMKLKYHSGSKQIFWVNPVFRTRRYNDHVDPTDYTIDIHAEQLCKRISLSDRMMLVIKCHVNPAKNQTEIEKARKQVIAFSRHLYREQEANTLKLGILVCRYSSKAKLLSAWDAMTVLDMTGLEEEVAQVSGVKLSWKIFSLDQTKYTVRNLVVFSHSRVDALYQWLLQ